MVPKGLRTLLLDRGDGGYPRLGRLPAASRRRAVAPCAGEGRGARRQRAVEPGALGNDLEMTDKRTITVSVNGAKHTKEEPVRITLADFIRYELGLTGT